MYLKTYKSIRIKDKQDDDRGGLLTGRYRGRGVNIVILNKLLLIISNLGKTKYFITLFKSI